MSRRETWDPHPRGLLSSPPPLPLPSKSSSVVEIQETYSMSTRGGGYGMDAELARKSAMKYDPQKEAEARE